MLKKRQNNNNNNTKHCPLLLTLSCSHPLKCVWIPFHIFLDHVHLLQCQTYGIFILGSTRDVIRPELNKNNENEFVI